MSWTDTFKIWIEQGKSKTLLLARLNAIHTNYPDQLNDEEYNAILALINEAYPS